MGIFRHIFLLLLAFCALPLQAHPSLDQLRCELQLAQVSGERQREFDGKISDVRRLIDEGQIPGYVVHFKSAYVDRPLPILVPESGSLHNPQVKNLLENTVGILWRDTAPIGEALGHAYVRVGNRIYDLQIADTYGADFIPMMEKRFKHGFTKFGREGRAPFFESIFPISSEAKAELIRFFEDRANKKVTMDGRPVTTHWQLGRKDFNEHGIFCEDCGSFSSSFADPRWWGDYPGLRQATKDTGLVNRQDAANSALRYPFDAEAHTLGLVIWDVHHGENHLNQRHLILDKATWPYEWQPER